MRNVLLYIASSLDGYIAYPDGGIQWLLQDDDYGYTDFYGRIDTTLMGNRTYNKIMSVSEFPYGDKENYVFTKNPALSGRRSHINFVNDDAVEFVRALRQKPGKDIWLVGGAELASTFQMAGLVNEIILSVHPTLLGKGISLFGSMMAERSLTLLRSRTWPSGLCQLHYRVATPAE